MVKWHCIEQSPVGCHNSVELFPLYSVVFTAIKQVGLPFAHTEA